MANYAQIDGGLVVSFFETDGDITQMFHPSIIFVNCDNWPAIQLGWIAEKINNVWSFRPWTISPEEILRINTLNMAHKKQMAYEPMALALLDARLCAYDERPGMLVAKAWQDYWAAVEAVDMTQEYPAWPTPPVTPA